MTIHRAITSGELSAQTERGRVLIAEADLQRWIKARQTPRGRRRGSLMDLINRRLGLAEEVIQQ
jgi:hypothetical protein